MTPVFQRVGRINAIPRNANRSFSDVQKAIAHHKDKGYDLTPISASRKKYIADKLDFSLWGCLDILCLSEGVKLPDKQGLYGFFNLDTDALPIERVLYIGMSLKSLKQRVTKNHSKYCKALRHRASHVCYIVNSETDETKRSAAILEAEIALIQYWSPYLNRSENIFNFEIEDRRF